MMVFGLIALIAGAASALMFASIVSGALISLVLVYLAPLPLMLAAIAWGPLCGALGGLVATLVIAGALSPPLALGYGLAFALPAWWHREHRYGSAPGRMVSAWTYPALDCGAGDAADRGIAVFSGKRCVGHQRCDAPRLCQNSFHGERDDRYGERSPRRPDGRGHSGPGRRIADGDADLESLACRQGRGCFRSAASA